MKCWVLEFGKEEDGTGINNETLEERDMKNTPCLNWSGSHVYLHVSAQQWSKLRTVTIRRPSYPLLYFLEYPDLCMPMVMMPTNPNPTNRLASGCSAKMVSPSVSRGTSL